MKLGKYAAGLAALAMALCLGGCASTDKLSTNLGGATRDNGFFNYNDGYRGAATGDTWTNRDYGRGYGRNVNRGAGYWDYYGVTDGNVKNTTTINNSGRYVKPNTVTDNAYGRQSVYGIGGKATKDNTSKTNQLDSAAIAG